MSAATGAGDVFRDRSALDHAFRSEANYCRRTGSPFAAEFLLAALEDIERGGPIADLIAGWSGHPVLDVLPLRLLAAVHRSVLAGEAPELERDYPSVGGRPAWPGTWDRVLRFVRANGARLRPRLAQQMQTNEVLRSAILLPGFLLLAGRFGLPLRLLEIGASAGLNLLWDRYHYTTGSGTWGDPRSPLHLSSRWEGPAPPLSTRVAVDDRSGCDLTPLDPRDPDAALTLESFIWADQVERLARLRAALAIARQGPPRVDRSPASDWLRPRLEEGRQGVLTVVFHSVMWWYLSEPERAEVTDVLGRAGARAAADRPLAWLRLEGLGAHAELRLTAWPRGEEELLAHAEYNGQWLQWKQGLPPDPPPSS